MPQTGNQTILTRNGDNLRIDFRINPVTRLFGLPFLLFAAYFLYTELRSILDVVRGNGGFLEMLPGQILLLVMAAAFGFPGVALALSRKWILIDVDRDVVEDVRSYALFQRRTRTPLATFHGVRALLRLAPHRDGSDTSTYDVELVATRDAQRLLIGIFDAANDAVSFGKDVATRLHLPLENHVGSDPQMDEDDAAEAAAERR